MSFGEGGFGDTPLVLTPQDAPKRRVVPTFQSHDIDVTRRTVAIDVNGFYKSIHPVDHRLRLALMVELGVVPADPSLGSTLRSVAFDTDENMTADGTRRVRRALKSLLDGGDIVLSRVNVYGGEIPGAPGRLVFEIEYRNLRLPTNEQMRQQVFTQ